MQHFACTGKEAVRRNQNQNQANPHQALHCPKTTKLAD